MADAQPAPRGGAGCRRRLPRQQGESRSAGFGGRFYRLVVLDVHLELFVNRTLVIRRTLSLAMLLATGTAQAMATACPMGVAIGGSHHAGVHFESTDAAAHDDHHAAASSHEQHRALVGAEADAPVNLASGPASRAPLDAGVPCALTMSCAPSIPASKAPLDTPAGVAVVMASSVSNQLLSPDINGITPPPRPLA